MTHMGRSVIAALVFAFATVTAGGADAAPGKGRRPSQVIPTGAEDAAAPAARARAAAPSDTGEALIDHITRKDTVGLYQEVLSDGSVTVNLDDRFQHVSRAMQNGDGTTTVVCDDHAAAPAKAAKPSKKSKGKVAKQAPTRILRTSAAEEM